MLIARVLGSLLLLAAFASGAAADGAARPAALAAQSLLQAIAPAGSRVVAVGDYGLILVSDDAGVTWRQAAEVPTRTTLTAVMFIDAKRGWAVGHGGLVLATLDGGEHWKVQFGRQEAENSLFSVWFSDPLHGVAVGPFGYAIATVDGGQRWWVRPVGEGEDAERHLNGIFAGNHGRLLVAAESGGVFISDDGGTVWRLITLPYAGSVWGGMRLADSSLIVWGMAGHALRSLDNGETWAELATHTNQSLTAGAQLSDGRVVLAGLGGALTVADKRLNWHARIRDDRQLATAILMTPRGLLMLTGAGVQTIPLD